MRKQVIWIVGCLTMISGFGLHNSAIVGAETIDCQAALLAEQSKLLALDFHNFDQTPQHGWRWLGEELKCYREAAELIVRYLDTQSELSASEIEILSFHAGQMFASSNDYEAAIPYLRKGYQKLENIPPTFRSEAKPYVAS
jgi:hypothetical protein